MRTRAGRAFYSVAAQDTNLGDAVLRRRLDSWISETGVDTHVHVGEMSSSYLEIFDNDWTYRYRSNLAWALALVRSISRSRVSLILFPGPQRLVRGGPELAHAVGILALAALVRLSGGSVIKVGRSFTGSSRIMTVLERAFRALSDHYSVRDDSSRRLVGRTCQVVADLGVGAFGDGGGDTPRDALAVSLRGDQAVPESLLDAVQRLADDRGLAPVLVTQVRSDRTYHAEIAGRRSWEHIDWPEPGHHPAQLARVRSTYRRSRFVVTNRLHSAIFAWNEGTVPIGVSTHPNDKIARHLRSLGLDDLTVPSNPINELSIAARVHDTWLDDLSSSRFAAALLGQERVREEVVSEIADGPRPSRGAARLANIRRARVWSG